MDTVDTVEVVLLCGWSGSGKDFIADCFTHYGFSKLSFACELKKIVAMKYNIPIEMTYTQEGKRQRVEGTEKTVRDLLIQEGQEIRSKKGTGYFAELVADLIKEKSLKRVVISDWRFPIELETLQTIFNNENARFHAIRIVHHKQHKSPVDDTYTENQLDRYPYMEIFENPGTFSSFPFLYSQIKFFLENTNIYIENLCGVEINAGIDK